MLALPNALSALASYPQFILYTLVSSSTRPGKTDKFPVDWQTGKVADAHNPAIWIDAQTACATAAAYGASYGVGFVFTEADPFFFIDIDNCVEGDKWSPIAQQLLGAFNGALVEVSASGKGLHIIGRGQAPVHSSKNAALGLEFYSSARFVALTGTNATGDAGTDHTQALAWLCANYFPPRVIEHSPEWLDGETDPATDAALIERMLRSQSAGSAFGSKVSFRDLWENNVDALAHAYPDPLRDYDASRADAALAQHLAFWCARDCARMLRIMQQSALVRPKWEREDYLVRTIAAAASQQREVFTEREPVATVAAPTAAQGTFVTVDKQADFFKGCVYVTDEHAIFVPGGELLNESRFRVRYGGRSFPMDPANERVTRNAWEAFTESQAVSHPQVQSTCFRPDLAPGTVVTSNGQTMVNTYWPIVTPRIVGDASRFLRHLSLLLPDERDRQIVLSYMAAIVQYKGKKFQWTILLQGAPGNGKTLLSRCVEFAVGEVYSHFPSAQNIANKFNGWLYKKLFIGVEDIHVPETKEDVTQALLPMITGERIEIERKGLDQITRGVCANFMLNANRKDALRKLRDDRRYAIFFTAQQSKADIERDGMGGDYFPDLYDWLRKEGYAIVNEYLSTYEIPREFNPMHTAHRAPETSTTEQAISAGMGRVEQEILEAIEQGKQGFCGGWVSSLMVDYLLKQIRADGKIPPNKRRDVLQSLGYDWHPGLKEGRVNNIVSPDNGKPRLFVKLGTPQAAIVGPAEIAKAYSAAQKLQVSAVTI